MFSPYKQMTMAGFIEPLAELLQQNRNRLALLDSLYYMCWVSSHIDLVFVPTKT